MNRVVLVGNGFDLALGLSTGYNDFITDFVRGSFIDAAINGSVDNGLIRANPKFVNMNKAAFESGIHGVESMSDLLGIGRGNLKLELRYEFFNKLLKEYSNRNWVDIERAYYRDLIKYVSRLNHRGDAEHQQIINLNACMYKLKGALNEYIHRAQNKSVNYSGPTASVLDDTLQPLQGIATDVGHIEGTDQDPDIVLFVNFNYTNTLRSILLSSYSNVADQMIHLHIHGQVDDEDNPIVFGYGDDTDDNYGLLESHDNYEEYLKNIKAFDYGKSSRYHKLISLINSDIFDVFILGHSCGLSDKTMLKTIFENPNCKAIRTYHYCGYPEYRKKYMAVSRHFQDKANLRAKLLPYDPNANLAQTKA